MHPGSPSPTDPDDAAMFDVAIIGCGPVGALAANLMAAADLNILVIDRETVPHPLPRAVHLDHEMMRLFQSVGLVDRIRSGMNETDGHLHIGADRGVIRYMGTVGRPKPFGWANDYFFYQPELEDWLREGIARFPNADLQLGVALETLTQDASGVTLGLSRDGVETEVRAAFAIGCDGARSTVRRLMGITLDDLDFEEPWLVIDVEVQGPVRFPDLWGVPDTADLQRLSVMMCDPERPATVVPGRGNIRRWEFMLLPGEDDTEMMRPETVAGLLAPYLDGVPHTILRASTYRFHGLVAQRWQDGRIFLAGDAAHQTPPFFGQGMCHGMRDVANLAWKLDMVKRKQAGAALLETYQPERDPHVRAVITAAVEAGRYICELDPARADARDVAMRERAQAGATGTAADLIPPIRKGVVAGDTKSAGERFVQPRAGADTALLDDVTGHGWRLFITDGSQLDRTTQAAEASAIDLAVIDVATVAGDGALSRWLDDRGASAVLVRPDFYVFGTTAGDPAILIDMLQRLLVQPAKAMIP
jgi:3-(3-hydroxy-phenyl)propionate hydroxylase